MLTPHLVPFVRWKLLLVSCLMLMVGISIADEVYKATHISLAGTTKRMCLMRTSFLESKRFILEETSASYPCRNMNWTHPHWATSNMPDRTFPLAFSGCFCHPANFHPLPQVSIHFPVSSPANPLGPFIFGSSLPFVFSNFRPFQGNFHPSRHFSMSIGLFSARHELEAEQISLGQIRHSAPAGDLRHSAVHPDGQLLGAPSREFGVRAVRNGPNGDGEETCGGGCFFGDGEMLGQWWLDMVRWFLMVVSDFSWCSNDAKRWWSNDREVLVIAGATEWFQPRNKRATYWEILWVTAYLP